MEEKGIVDLFQKVAGYRVSRFCVQLENVLCPPMPRRGEDALYVENPLRTGGGCVWSYKYNLDFLPFDLLASERTSCSRG